jgi:small conductance mechanosensitive channel
MTDIGTVSAFIATAGLAFGLKILGAIVAWIVGRWLIGWVSGILERMLERNGRLDVTVCKYLASILSAILTLILILAIFEIFGVQTTSFAALFAGLGLAIGVAWGGLLAHFASGVFLQVLRPFKVGEYVLAGGIEGTVKELGLFFTKIVTPDNVETIVGNGTIFAGTIKNFSTLPVRRVECTAKVANSVNPLEAIAKLRPAVAAIPNVAQSPAPDIEILSFTPEGPLLAVRPYTFTDHYWQVWFDTNKAIVETFGAAGYPVPQTPIVAQTHA